MVEEEKKMKKDDIEPQNVFQIIGGVIVLNTWGAKNSKRLCGWVNVKHGHPRQL